jgi:hypothetical protein
MAQESSYLVVELIAQKRKSQKVGKNVIMSAYTILVDKMLGQEAIREIEIIPLSNSTINRHIDDVQIILKKFL